VFSLFALLITDLIFYLTHYWQHFTKLGWSLHQTHHSQTELNIFTDDRETPLNFILISLFPSGVLGALVGVFLYLFPDAHDILVADLSIGLLLWMPTKIFRHSHILIRFPKWIEYLIQSPAFHIVHHSDLPQHRNKNLGNWTTVWDRIFGTLYVPQPKESYRFGIGDELLERSHKSLIGIYFWQTGRVLKQLCSPFLPNPKP
jgi:sterol desaturase/sphingolipid hydroxylase (fatty acid hydroxylase superfamily)